MERTGERVTVRTRKRATERTGEPTDQQGSKRPRPLSEVPLRCRVTRNLIDR